MGAQTGSSILNGWAPSRVTPSLVPSSRRLFHPQRDPEVKCSKDDSQSFQNTNQHQFPGSPFFFPSQRKSDKPVAQKEPGTRGTSDCPRLQIFAGYRWEVNGLIAPFFLDTFLCEHSFLCTHRHRDGEELAISVSNYQINYL